MSTIELKQGPLKGITKKSILTGKQYICYLGIPYAEPPIGDLRFQPPQPFQKWDGVLKAHKEGSVCFQKNYLGKLEGSEDCLYLNVYIPEHPTKSTFPKAVMVYIHGGHFFNGSATSGTYSADYLINYDVILVSINYRLHALGFMDMGTENCAGNCGLRDQCLALKWVKDNISQFGGDPENVTIFGESAGASSVYLQVLSPMSNGLINKAIIQSDMSNIYYERGRDLPKAGFKLGQKMGFDGKDPEKLVEFLKKQPVDEICKQTNALVEESPKNQRDLFGPHPEIIKENAFLPDTYENLKKQAIPIPVMAGLTDKDGRLVFSLPTVIEELRNDFTSVLTNNEKYVYDSHRLTDICDQIKKHYLGDKPVDEEAVDDIADLYTDYLTRRFYDCIDFTITSKVPVFIYEFSFLGKFNVVEKTIVKNIPVSKSGACHADELPYLFYFKSLLPPPVEFREPETTVIKHMCSLWTNFAKSANPTASIQGVQWRPYDPEKPCYLRIDKELKLVEEKLRGKGHEFWKKLFD